MMYCRICGATEDSKPKWFDGKWVEVHPSKGWQALCVPCNHETPDKVSKSDFEAKMWVDDEGNNTTDMVPFTTRKEFYQDYLASTYGPVEDYIAATRS